MAPEASLPEVPRVVGELLEEFCRGRDRHARVWLREGEAGEWVLVASTGDDRPPGPGPEAVDVPSIRGISMKVEVRNVDDGRVGPDAGFLAAVLGRLLKYDAETRFFGRELAERYEEITLLYSISEILGSVISLEEAASTILSEVAGTLGVQRAALWLHDPGQNRLEMVAAFGEHGRLPPVSLDDPASVTAAVFRDRRTVILEPDDEYPRGEYNREITRGSFLSVPVSYTPPRGQSRTIGVINLIGRVGDETFLAGDQKLITAIASQIGAAVENNRLVAESLRQERMVRELELAHDLQLKLLPSVDQFAGYAEVAARCAPAESVGGDFYHLFRLPGGRLGVMIGDVSTHGFGAALIMALTMSAVAIHASEDDSPAEVLARTHRALIDELENTEMYMTLFYGVIDPARGNITYANAGHSHAFHVAPDGGVSRLGAADPPFGIVDLDHYAENVAPWAPGQDLLFLCTDGLADALGLGEQAGERTLLDVVVRGRTTPVAAILDGLFDLQRRTGQVPPDDRTAVLVRI